MSRVATLHFSALWQKRAAETEMGLRITDTAPREKPRDRWAIRTLARGALAGELIEAAEKYARLLEKMHVQRSCAIAERVSGGLSDPHARILHSMDANRGAAAARAHLDEHCRPAQLVVFDLAFATPHLSIAEMKRRLGRRGGAGYDFILRALSATLTRLWGYWMRETAPHGT